MFVLGSSSWEKDLLQDKMMTLRATGFAQGCVFRLSFLCIFVSEYEANQSMCVSALKKGSQVDCTLRFFVIQCQR